MQTCKGANYANMERRKRYKSATAQKHANKRDKLCKHANAQIMQTCNREKHANMKRRKLRKHENAQIMQTCNREKYANMQRPKLRKHGKTQFMQTC